MKFVCCGILEKLFICVQDWQSNLFTVFGMHMAPYYSVFVAYEFVCLGDLVDLNGDNEIAVYCNLVAVIFECT